MSTEATAPDTPLESLLLFSHSPYNSNLSKEGLDLALAAAAFETRQALVLVDDGVYCAISQHNGANIGQKDISKILQVLPLYEVEELYYCSKSVEQRGLNSTELNAQFKPLSSAEINALINRSQQVFTF